MTPSKISILPAHPPPPLPSTTPLYFPLSIPFPNSTHYNYQESILCKFLDIKKNTLLNGNLPNNHCHSNLLQSHSLHSFTSMVC